MALREAIAAGDEDAAKSAFATVASAVDKGIQKVILNKTTASRKKARLNAREKAITAKQGFYNH